MIMVTVTPPVTAPRAHVHAKRTRTVAQMFEVPDNRLSIKVMVPTWLIKLMRVIMPHSITIRPQGTDLRRIVFSSPHRRTTQKMTPRVITTRIFKNEITRDSAGLCKRLFARGRAKIQKRTPKRMPNDFFCWDVRGKGFSRSAGIHTRCPRVAM